MEYNKNIECQVMQDEMLVKASCQIRIDRFISEADRIPRYNIKLTHYNEVVMTVNAVPEVNFVARLVQFEERCSRFLQQWLRRTGKKIPVEHILKLTLGYQIV